MIINHRQIKNSEIFKLPEDPKLKKKKKKTKLNKINIKSKSKSKINTITDRHESVWRWLLAGDHVNRTCMVIQSTEDTTRYLDPIYKTSQHRKIYLKIQNLLSFVHACIHFSD